MEHQQVDTMNLFLEAGISDISQIDEIEEWWKLTELLAVLKGWRHLSPEETSVLMMYLKTNNYQQFQVLEAGHGKLMVSPDCGHGSTIGWPPSYSVDSSECYALFESMAKKLSLGLICFDNGWCVVEWLSEDKNKQSKFIVCSGKGAKKPGIAILRRF